MLHISEKGARVSVLNYIIVHFSFPGCSRYVGAYPSPYSIGGLGKFNLMVDNTFPCDGNVTSWDLQRINPDHTGTIEIYRPQTTPKRYKMIHGTHVPKHPAGLQIVVPSQPLPVLRGDVIAVRHRPLGLHFISNEYQNFPPFSFITVQCPSNMLPGVDGIIDISTWEIKYRVYALRAMVEY